MVAMVEKYSVDEIVIAVSGDLTGGTFQSVMDCYERGVQITPMPVMYESLTGRVPVEHVGKSWSIVLPMAATPPGRLYQMTERIADVGLALVGMVLLLAVCPLVALANYFLSPGPLFYAQTRVGRGGKLYKILKFRSMIPDAEKRSGAVWAQEADARITPVGHFLRKTRLDEIPQFWNVLKGEMSMVGPRPERPEFVEQLAISIPFYRSRHAVKPGVTGWAQVKYRYGASVEDALMKLQYDLYYIKHQSLLLNLFILYKTIRVVIGFQGR
jgi:exopolysaccharide biosynthesis polyprenyl glycosylphosphotransferase